MPAPADLLQLLLLLPLAIGVAALAGRLRLSSTPVLLASGAAAAAVPWPFHLGLTRELLFGLLLPPLIFEAGLVLPWQALRRDLPVLLLISTAGVALAAAVVGLGMAALAGWPWQAAILFGALIAATDPVAVIAFFKQSQTGGRVRLLVEAESLFNDGTAAVLFGVLLALAGGAPAGPAGILLRFAWTCLGALATGAGVAWLVTSVLRRLPRGPAWMAGSALAAFVAFGLAERLGSSGVLSTLVAGLLFGNRMECTDAAPDGSAGAGLAAFWEHLAFAANALVFVLIGVEVVHQAAGLSGRDVLWVLPLVLLGRVAAVVPCSAPFAGGSQRVPWPMQLVMIWGGLRGALALALAMALPEGLAGRSAILPATCAVVLFSLLVQAGTLPWLVRRLAARSARR